MSDRIEVQNESGERMTIENSPHRLAWAAGKGFKVPAPVEPEPED